MEKIFLNFRTGDQDMAASFLHRYLSRWFGRDSVFFSSHSIPAGAPFAYELERQAGNCQVMLALIGPRWLTMPGPDGRALLADPDDWVRREIATALAAGRRVVPVLVANAPRLTPDGLPADLAPLARAEYRYLRRRDLDGDLRALRGDLVALIPGLRLRPEATADVGVEVGVNQGDVAAVRVRELRSRGSVPEIFGSPSARVDENKEDGVVTGVEIGKWDRLEEWGNVDGDHPPWPELPA